jgi:osmotically-inducible protein OsmY
LISLVHDARRATSKEPRDLALRHRVRTQIKSMVELGGCRLDVRVIRGVAVLTGSVEHLWQAEAAANIARSVPGVQDVVSRAVRVRVDESSDREISTAIRKLVRVTSGLDPATLALEVDEGNVVLAGTVDSPLELDRVCSLIRNVRGVRSLKSYVTVSRNERRRDKELARQVQKALALRYPKERARVSVFGGIVVLHGLVGLAETREALRTLAAIQPGVERVVNKLTVRRSSGRRDSG